MDTKRPFVDITILNMDAQTENKSGDKRIFFMRKEKSIPSFSQATHSNIAWRFQCKFRERMYSQTQNVGREFIWNHIVITVWLEN
jgi:hypothetical protein